MTIKTRSSKLERIDTGDYTPEEYERFLREIGFINRVLGDRRALEKTLLREIAIENSQAFSVLDVGAGSGELLRAIAADARRANRKARLCGLELNARSARAIAEESENFPEIEAVRADAFSLPFADGSFDYAICSLFMHHFADENAVKILAEMNRAARRKIFVVDLHRHRAARFFYLMFCRTFGISRLVREDGALSVLRSFTPGELKIIGEAAGLQRISVKRIAPFRLVLEGGKEINHERTRKDTKEIIN